MSLHACTTFLDRVNSYHTCRRGRPACKHGDKAIILYIHARTGIRPDQIIVLLLGLFKVKNGPSDRKKKIKISVKIPFFQKEAHTIMHKNKDS